MLRIYLNGSLWHDTLICYKESELKAIKRAVRTGATIVITLDGKEITLEELKEM